MCQCAELGVLAKQILSYLPSTIGTAIVSALSLVLYTRVLLPAEFGRYALVIGTVEFIQLICFEWISLSYQRFYHRNALDEQREFLDSSALGIAGLLCAVVPVIYSSILLMLPLSDQLKTALWFGLPLVILRGVLRLMLGRFRAKVEVFLHNLAEFSQMVLGLLIGILLIVVCDLSEVGALLGSAIGCGIVLLANIYRSKFSLQLKHFDFELTLSLLRYGLPMAIIFALTFVLTTSDRFFIQYFHGSEEVAWFTANYLLIMRSLDLAFAIVQIPMHNLNFAALEKGGVSCAQVSLKHNGTVLLFVGLPATVGITLISDPLGRLVLGPEYMAFSGWMILGVAVSIFVSRFKDFFLDEGFHLSYRTDLRLYSLVPAALLKISLSFLLIPFLGLAGAVIVLCAAQACAFVTTGILLRGTFPVTLPIMETLRILAASAIMGVVLLTAQIPSHPAGLVGAVVLGVGAFGMASIAFDTMGLRGRIRSYLRARLH
jgi:O-antigen/teichoic acid export membrane protein